MPQLTALRIGLVLSIALSGCRIVSSDRKPSREEAAKAKPMSPPKRAKAIRRASGLIGQGKLSEGLALLYELAEGDEDDQQVRYLLGRSLQDSGSLRPARIQLRILVKLNPKHALAWQRLGEVEQRLGEHQSAIAAFQRVAALVPKSVDAHRRIAANQLIRGEYRQTLATVAAARERLKEGKRQDVFIELLAAKAHRELGQENQARRAARFFFKLSEGEPAFDQERRSLQAWIKGQGIALGDADRSTLLGYARAVLSLSAKDVGAPERIAKEAGARLFEYDRSPVFLTVFPPGGLGAPLSGRGSGQSLLRSLARALNTVTRDPRFAKQLCRRAAIRISIQEGDLEPIKVSYEAAEPRRHRRVRAKPPVIPGVHGVAIDAGDVRPYVLPGDAASAGLSGLEAQLDYACRNARLSPRAWRGKRMFRFRSIAFAQASPGGVLIDLDQGEPRAAGATADSLRGAVLAAGAWLSRAVTPNGAIGYRYRPHGDRFLTPLAQDVELIDFERSLTLPVVAQDSKEGSKVSVKDGRLVLPVPGLRREGLRRVLDSRFALGSNIARIGSGTLTRGVPVHLEGMRAETLRIMIDAELGGTNMLRQLGTGWSLVRLHQWTGDQVSLKAAQRTAAWARRWLTVEPSPAGGKRAVIRYKGKGLAKLGAQALALLLHTSLDEAARAQGQKPRYSLLREQLARSILDFQNADGGFQSLLGETGAGAPQSRYYPGEAILALVEQSRAAGKPELLKAAERGARAQIKRWLAAESKGEAPLDHWFAKALLRLYQADPQPAYLSFARRIGAAFAALQRKAGPEAPFAGGVGPGTEIPHVIETACATEAFVAVAKLCRIAQSDSTLKKESLRFQNAALAAASFQLRHQIRPAHGLYLPAISRAIGAFRSAPDDWEVRIDGVQHNLISLLELADLVRALGRRRDG